MKKTFVPNTFFLLKIAYIIIALILFIYVATKAYLAGFTHDESITYTMAIGQKGWLLTANNHWLNTALSFFMAKKFGLSEFVLRLPNVLFFLVYLFFVYKICFTYVKNNPAILLAIPLFLFNPFVLQYFGLSRGYGIAMACSMITLYFFLYTLRYFTYHTFLQAAVWGVVTIYANYSFLTWIFALNCSYLIIYTIKKKAFFYNKYNLLIIFGQIFLLIPALINIFILKTSGHLIFGGRKNILTDTFSSIIQQSFPIILFPYQNMLILVIILFLIISSTYLVKNNIRIYFFAITSIILLILPTFFHLTMGVLYPLERTGIYWCLLFGLHVLFLTDHFLFYHTRKKRTHLFLFLSAILSITITIGFFTTLNLHSYPANHADHNTRGMLFLLKEKVDTTQSYRLGIDATFEPTINYYRQTHNLHWLQKVTRKGVKEDYDFFYVKNSSVPLIPSDCLNVIKSFDDTATQLLENCEN